MPEAPLAEATRIGMVMVWPSEASRLGGARHASVPGTPRWCASM